MIDLKKELENAVNVAHEDIESVNEFYISLYESYFSSYFSESHILFERLSSKEHPITDEELSWILISLPIRLFEVSEELNKQKLAHEVLKMKYKEKESEYIKLSTAKTVTQKKDEAALQMIGDSLVLYVYVFLISRVESEISFSRELIMGAKKIWDARRKTDSVMPVGEVETSNSSLPNYNKTYIHGSEF